MIVCLGRPRRLQLAVLKLMPKVWVYAVMPTNPREPIEIYWRDVQAFVFKLFKAVKKRTFVPPHPNLNAASWAKSSPKPNMSPLTNGNRRLIAAPRRRPHIVGGVYRIIGGELEEEGGDGESSSLPEYCSESDRMVMDDSVRGFSDDMTRLLLADAVKDFKARGRELIQGVGHMIVLERS